MKLIVNEALINKFKYLCETDDYISCKVLTSFDHYGYMTDPIVWGIVKTQFYLELFYEIRG